MRRLALGSYFFGGKCAESNGPPFEDYDLKLWLARLVDTEGGGGAVAVPVEGGLVIAGDGSFGLVEEAGEDGLGEGDVVGSCCCQSGGGQIEGKGGHTGLATMLDQRVQRIGLREGDLVGVGEIEVIEADDFGREVAFGLEGCEERGDEGGFPDALDAVDTYEKGGGG